MSILNCFTIGHSNHSLEKFTNLLKSHDIDCVVDIRSSPYSNHNSHFNRETLKDFLQSKSFTYLYLGDKLGGRFTDHNLLYSDGRVDFTKVSETTFFKEGIKRVINGIKKGYKIALMCSEKNPEDCHRFALVAYQLEKRDVLVEHILEDGSKISNKSVENHMINEFKKKKLQISMFEPLADKTENILLAAYKDKNKDIAYKVECEVIRY